jgi:drug/metabolite transporter (DMT)-like permease
VRRPAVPSTWALLLVGVVAVSFAGVLIRVADAPALALAFWRSFGGAVALVPAAARADVRPTAGERRALGLGGLLLALHFALFIGAFSFTSVAGAVLLVATSPLFVGLGAWLLLGQRPGRRTWAGIALAAAGTAVVGLLGTGGAPGSDPLLGTAMGLGGSVAASGYLLVGQRARTRLPVSVYGAWVYGAAAAVLLLAALVGGQPLVGFDAATWWAVAGLVVGPQLLGHTIFNEVLGRLPATTVAVVVLSEPVGAAVLALLLLGEAIPPGTAAGAPLVLAGVYLAGGGGGGGGTG